MNSLSSILRNLSASYLGQSTLSEATITCDEFINAIYHSRRRLSDNERWHQKKIGLAISGGVDSMALALLCSNLQLCDSLEYRRLRFHAFIVDHGIRTGSDREAVSVAKILASRGIPASISKIKWQIKDPHCLPNFESLARKERYRLLGKACYENDIDSLMLGHHEDDQAELIMMRIIAGHRGRGLVGMKPRTAIPECYGLYGIHESGGGLIDSNPICQPLIEKSKPSFMTTSIGAWHQDSNTERLRLETGGIQIYRPLLNFSKSRLIFTCKAYQIPWFEDKTNYDVTLTKRNAIRNLFCCHKIPDALSKQSLISLAKRISIKVSRLEEIVNHYLTKICICSFSSTSGTVKVVFPPLTHEGEKLGDAKFFLLSKVATELLRKIITLITPEEHIELSSLRYAVTRIFPELVHEPPKLLFPSQQKLEKKPLFHTKFTVAGVLFQPISLDTTHSHSHRIIENNMWLISRQPVPRVSIGNHTFIVLAAQENHPPFLFDGRFWIKIKNHSQTHDLVIRFFEPMDLKLFLNQFQSPGKKILLKKLAKIAPGNIRWTLPIICARQTVAAGSEFYQPLSLPSLKIDVPGANTFGVWQTHYKKIYTDHLKIPN
ncbi:putative tRNA-lysidine synthase [Erysiphe neolycopersici]|uniref:tRNA(Ile)-lysidine synthetase n=1 Tax=Erysiphe neolycopersici TaxID=212602 RepID=A0A420HLQ5_9PEZI|nr:putative tRNA-lysidine synthase [Erysiphe neolycopersici]